MSFEWAYTSSHALFYFHACFGMTSHNHIKGRIRNLGILSRVSSSNYKGKDSIITTRIDQKECPRMHIITKGVYAKLHHVKGCKDTYNGISTIWRVPRPKSLSLSLSFCPNHSLIFPCHQQPQPLSLMACH